LRAELAEIEEASRQKRKAYNALSQDHSTISTLTQSSTEEAASQDVDNLSTDEVSEPGREESLSKAQNTTRKSQRINSTSELSDYDRSQLLSQQGYDIQLACLGI